jgi:hypothetical protein
MLHAWLPALSKVQAGLRLPQIVKLAWCSFAGNDLKQTGPGYRLSVIMCHEPAF